MAVKLRLAGGGLTGASQTKLLERGTLSIGRGPGNDWVLPDPDRHLSKTHCVVSIENGRTILTDVSTNGVHINGARQATARDSRTELTDGDDFRLGDYTITVAAADPARASRGAAALDDPFHGPAGPAEGSSPLDFDPLDDPLGRPPTPGFSHPVAHRPTGPKREDPFDVAEERARRSIDPDDDLFRGTRPTTEWQGPTQPDHADAPRHAFAPPSVSPAVDPNAIDFDALIGDLGPAAPTPRSPSPPPPPAQARRPPPPDPFADLDGLLAANPAPAAMPPPAAPTQDPFAEPARPGPRPAPRPGQAAAPPPPVSASGDAETLLRAFLEGAGVPQSALAGADPQAAMRAVGELFRAMTAGLREVLLSRAAIKSDMRVEQTMIRARDNNALKFSVTVDDAVTALLQKDRPGYMAPLAAAREAFGDIKSHELAVMAGVQTALMSLLQRFDPATLEKRLAQGRLASVLPSARKARYWDSFVEVYGEIAREAEDDFQAVFGREFAKAYAAQTKKDGQSN